MFIIPSNIIFFNLSIAIILHISKALCNSTFFPGCFKQFPNYFFLCPSFIHYEEMLLIIFPHNLLASKQEKTIGAERARLAEKQKRKKVRCKEAASNFLYRSYK